MRRMLLVACAVGLCGSVAVVAFAADAPIPDRPRAPTPGGADAAIPKSGPFALAAERAQSDAMAKRHRAARKAYADRNPYDSGYVAGEYRPSTAPRPGGGPGYGRVRLIGRLAARLGIGRRTMWRAVFDVRRQISPREWSDARGEALRMLARELGRPYDEVARAVRIELRRELVSRQDGYAYEAGQ